MPGLYILNEHGDPVEEPDVRKWGEWYEVNERGLARDEVGPFTISTVFLALDHAFGDGKPLLYETMVFVDAPEEYFGIDSVDGCWRYAHREHADWGHDEAVWRIRHCLEQGLDPTTWADDAAWPDREGRWPDAEDEVGDSCHTRT